MLALLLLLAPPDMTKVTVKFTDSNVHSGYKKAGPGVMIAEDEKSYEKATSLISSGRIKHEWKPYDEKIVYVFIFAGFTNDQGWDIKGDKAWYDRNENELHVEATAKMDHADLVLFDNPLSPWILATINKADLPEGVNAKTNYLLKLNQTTIHRLPMREKDK